MKLKFLFPVIIASTFILIGLVYWAVEKVDNAGNFKDLETFTKEKTNELEDSDLLEGQKNTLDRMEGQKGTQNRDEQEKEEKTDHLLSSSQELSLNNEDRTKIMSVVKLSDAELAREINALKDVIDEEDIFDDLEEGTLSKEDEQKAKELLEKFALLGLEANRRKFQATDPNLKDGLYAHRDSLKQIREALSDD